MIYFILIILVALLLFFILKGRKKTAPTDHTNTSDDLHGQAKNSPYDDLRNMALSTTADQLDITLAGEGTSVYGVVMDWYPGRGSMTLTSFATGDASIYFSSGGGIIGGGQHASVNQAAKEFTASAQQYLSHARIQDTGLFPGQNMVCFHLLTNNGIFAVQEDMKHMEDGTSPLLPLFHEANIVITYIRQIDEAHKNQYG